MICPKCGRGKLKVTGEALLETPGEAVRKRYCTECDALFESTEVLTAVLERREIGRPPKKVEVSA
jgi:transcriptional regulator NrdR family protein